VVLGETSASSGLALMAGQVISQTLGNTFVKKDLHPSWPTRAALASSRVTMASCRHLLKDATQDRGAPLLESVLTLAKSTLFQGRPHNRNSKADE
jgi:hypothetical protein